MSPAALLGVGNCHTTARRLRKPQLEGWHGPRRKTGKALLLPQHRVLMGRKEGFLIQAHRLPLGKSQKVMGEVRSGLLLER